MLCNVLYSIFIEFVSVLNSVPSSCLINISKTIEYDDLSIYYLRTKNFKFIAKDKKTLVINNTGQRIAEIDATSNAFLIGNTLYDTQDKSFVTIDLSEMIKNE